MSTSRRTATTVLFGIGLGFAVLIAIGLATGAVNLNSPDGVLTLAGPLLGLLALIPLLFASNRSTCSKGCIFRAWRRKPAPAPIEEA